MEELKSILKVWAVQIRELKSQRKSSPNGYVPGLLKLRWDYRHHHIAYCELRGRTREEIEQPSYWNPVYNNVIETIKDKYREVADEEAVCCSQG